MGIQNNQVTDSLQSFYFAKNHWLVHSALAIAQPATYYFFSGSNCAAARLLSGGAAEAPVFHSSFEFSKYSALAVHLFCVGS